MEFFKRYSEYGMVFLRLGFAATLLFSVFTKLSSTSQVAGMFGKAGIGGGENLVTAMAIVLIIVSLMLIFGFATRLAAGFLTLFFLVTLIAAFNVGPAVWKDFALLGASLALLFNGPGPKLAWDTRQNAQNPQQ